MNLNFISNQLANHLELVLGSEDIVKKRRQKYVESNINTSMGNLLFSGSSSEGFDLPNQDLDIMFVSSSSTFKVIDYRESAPSSECTFAQLVYNPKFQGSVMLKVIHRHLLKILSMKQIWFQIQDKWCTFHKNMFVLDAAAMRNKYKSELGKHLDNIFVTGPCVHYDMIDFALGLQLPFWPKCANEWQHRNRKFKWPSKALIDFIVNNVECHVMPISDVKCDIQNLLWRLSFSRAETVLVSSFSYLQFQIYGLMKLFLKKIPYKEICGKEEPYTCSYHVKNIMFHIIENSPAILWSKNNLFQCYWMGLQLLVDCLEKGYLPHYFVPGLNLLLKREEVDNRVKTLSFLEYYLHKPTIEVFEDPNRLEGIDNRNYLKMNLNKEFINDRIDIFGATSYVSIVSCNDKLFRSLCPKYKYGYSPPTSYNDYLMLGTFIMKTSLDIIKTSKETDFPNKSKYSSLHKAKNGLILCSNLDSTKGWLTLAYYFYELSNYRKSLEMCKIATENFNKPWVSYFLANKSIKVKQEEHYFKELIGKDISIFEKIKKAKVIPINFCEISTDDFKPEVEYALDHFNMVIINPLIYASLLKFLCHHHMKNTNGRLDSLIELQRYIKHDTDNCQRILISIATVHSCAGVCCEMLGDYSQAAAHYNKANEEYTCSKRHKLYDPAADRLRELPVGK